MFKVHENQQKKYIQHRNILVSRLTLLYPNAQVYYFGEQVLGLLAVEQANFVLKASAPSNIAVVVADAGNIHVLKS